MEQKNQITEGVIWKQLLIFFFPIVIGTFFQQIYNTADSIIVGRFVGKEALAAVGGSVNQIINLMVEVFVGLTSGAAVIVAQFYGAGDRKNLDRTIHTSYAFALTVGILTGLLGIFGLRACSPPYENTERTYGRFYDLSSYLFSGNCV